MNRRLFLMGLAGLAGCTRNTTARLNVFNWSEYVAPETIPGFEREFNVRVRYGVYESAEEMLARLMSGNSGWDVVFPPNYFIQPMVQLGLLASLDHSQLDHLNTLDPRFRKPHWDPDLRYGIPYMWGATGILHQSNIQPPFHAWADLWAPRVRNRITMLDDPSEVLGASLKSLGFSLNSQNPAELARAKDHAALQKPLLRAYVNEIVRDQLVAGELMAAQVWRSTAMRAIESAGPRLTFVYPREGYPLYADSIAVLKESKRRTIAHAFINYLTRPKVAARVSEVKLESTCNALARALLPATLRDHPVLYPDDATLDRGEWFAPLSGEAQKLRDRLWTEIKSS
ncbi:MAG: spermidine/putrescine ABC transporter substrate-binding protein [Bryobacterales bacterium]|nr:spermidine/putrescine ABC transporter substrate-binding protein [Bryobacterales bacterium]